jgi:LacI family gluconate utilization system Gnt-I transcriptional repressor
MEDVAKLAGVTKMTVSRALHQPSKVAEATRERIEWAIGQTGFVANLNAGSLSSQKTRIIAALVPTFQHAVFAETIQGISDVIRPRGFHLLVADTQHSQREEHDLVQAFLARRPEALVLTGIRHSAATRNVLMRARIPIVETWETTGQPIDMAVGISNFDAAVAMVRSLHAAGYRRIGFVNGRLANNERVQLRAKGYEAALAELDMGPPVEVVIEQEPVRIEHGERALAELLAIEPGIDAVFCANDIFAAGVLIESRRRSISVPDRLGIAGFHDLDIARLTTPQLTTVKVPAYDIGRLSAQMVVDRLDGKPAAGPTIELDFSILRRGSTR